MLSALRSLPRTVWQVGLISLVNDSASEMLYPLIPFYLSSVLMAGPRALGIIEGIAEVTASLLKLFSGVIVDRTRRARPWMIFGYGLAEFFRGKMIRMIQRAVLYFTAFLLLSLSWACRQEQEQPKASVPNNASAVLTIAAVGDSLTAGLGVEENESYPALLEKRLQSGGYDVRVINAGVSGETSSGTLARIDWLLTLKPDVVILETGANDGLRGIDPGLVRGNLEKIVEMLQEKGIIVVFVGMRMVWNLGPGYTTGFNQVYPEIAAEKKLIFMPFFLEGVATNPELNLDDGLHPNPQGYTVIVDNLLPFVKHALAEAAKVQGVKP